MIAITMETCVAEMNRASLNRKAALQIELAVGLAVFLTASDPKVTLCEVYANAGYQCLLPSGMDYKTVNRRINATGELFKFLTVDKLKKWVGRNHEADMITALVLGLEPYSIVAMSDVQRLAYPLVTKVAAHTRTRVERHLPVLEGPATGHNGVIEQFRRASDKPGTLIMTEHIHLTIPVGITTAELIELSTKLLALAKERRGELLTS